MQTKNHISHTHIIITSFCLILVVLFSTINIRYLPPVQAQDAATYTPTLQATETPTVIPTESATVTPAETPDVKIEGANCSSPVVFDDQWSSGFRLVCQNNLYVLMIDLTNPAIKVEVMASPSGNHTLDWYTDSNTIAVINADYQYNPCPSGALCSNGLTISNGSTPTNYTILQKLCNDGWVRREIGFSQDGRPMIDWWYKFVSDSQARNWCSPWHAEGIPNGDSGGGKEQYSYNLVGAGPQFTFDGSFKWECGDGSQNHDCPGTDVVINGEHFKPGSWWQRYQSAIGYSSDSTTLVLAESNNATHTIQNVHDIMYQRLSIYGKTLKNAFKFDGGSVAGFWYYNHTYDSTPGVSVPNVIRIQRTNSTCYSISTNINPGGSGNVSVNTPSNCAQGKYTPGTSIQLNASPNGGYSFNNWSGDASGTSSGTTIVMNSNKSVTANFSSTTFALNVSKSGIGSGTVTSNPAGINCGSDCSESYANNTSVILTATPTAPSTFGGWSGAGCSGTGTCTVTMSSAQSVTATFNGPGNQTLTVSKSGTGSGTVTSSLTGINCGSTCSYAFAYNTVVTLTATPLSPSTFGGWSGGGCSGTGTCTITMSSAQSVTATFNSPSNQTLTVSKAGTGNGTVTSSPSGIDCGSDCSENYNYNTTVTLTATPGAGSSFAGWSGACSGTGSCTLSMTTARSVTATFTSTSGGSCIPASSIAVDGSHSYRNDGAGSTNVIDSYPDPAPSWNESGPEYTYSFITNAAGQVTVSLSNMSADLDIFILDGSSGNCNPSNTITGSDSSASFSAVSGQTYYFVVDGYVGAVSDYTISVTGPATTPGAAILVSPTGNIGTNYSPNFVWNVVSTATHYHLYVSGPSGVVLDQWYESANICNTTTCSVVSPTLGGGAHAWYVQTYNSAGYGPWSNNTQPTNFTVTVFMPAAAVLTAPIGNIGTNYTPNYTWNKVSTATWYRLHVSGPSGIILDQWYESSSICNSTTCSVASPTLLGGAHAWYVQTYSSAGYGPWSNNTQPTNFSTTIIIKPPAAVLTAPIGNIATNYNPTYTWNKVSTATWYRLYVSGPSGVVLDQWYESVNICNTTTCSVASPTMLGGGAHVWYVQTYNSAGYGDWSNNTQPTNFSTTIPTIPVAAVLTAPSGTIANHTPTYTWNKVNMATWYRLYVSGPGGVVKDQWYQAVSICNATTCSVVSPTLPSGAHIWYVQAYNTAGYSPWASSTFTVNP